MQVATRVDQVSSKIRVLVVDVSDSAHRWVAPSLRARLGAEVEHLNAGQELYDRVQAGDVDLVITNAQLPDHSGLQVLARCRTGGSQVPFVVFTAFQDECMRVFVSDTDGTVLSSRVVDVRGLTALALSLLERSPCSARLRPQAANADAVQVVGSAL